MWLSRIPYGDLVTESAHQARLRASAVPTWYDSQAQKFSTHQAGLMICHFEWALWGIDLDNWPTLTFRERFPGSALGPGFFLLLFRLAGEGVYLLHVCHHGLHHHDFHHLYLASVIILGAASHLWPARPPSSTSPPSSSLLGSFWPPGPCTW